MDTKDDILAVHQTAQPKVGTDDTEINPTVLCVIDKSNVKHFVPVNEGNRHYQIVQVWQADGNEIMPPLPEEEEE